MLVSEGNEIRTAVDQRSDLPPAEQRALLALADEIDAENLRFGKQMLARTGQHLGQQFDDLYDEISDITKGFHTVADYAGRPDADPAEVTQVQSDLDKRARVVKARLASWDEQKAEYDSRKQDIGAFVSGFRKKWASKSLTNAEGFLFHVPGL